VSSSRSTLARAARALLALSLLYGLAAPSLSAQGAPHPHRVDRFEPEPLPPVPRWVSEFTILSANAVFGGVTSGFLQKTRGGSFRDGFTRGFLGGSVVYAGKRLAVERFGGAGLLGRGVAATGASMVRNASDGHPPLERLILPVGPVRFYVDRGVGTAVRAKFDLNTLVLMGYAATRGELELQAASSLSAGTPVYAAREFLFGATEDTIRASGQVIESVIFLSELPWRHPEEAREVFAHERIHLLQRDQLFITLTEPLSARIVREAPVLQTLYRYIDFHPTDIVFRLLQVPFPQYETRPWELEAFHLSRP
jgi:hypothetical protein